MRAIPVFWTWLFIFTILLLPACNTTSQDQVADGDMDVPDGDLETDAENNGDSDDVGEGDLEEATLDHTKWADCQPNTQAFPVRPAPTEVATLPFLHVDGTDIVDEDDNNIMLRGVNFGSWMMMETWLSGVGLLFEWDFLKLIPIKAEEYGVAELVQNARDQTAFDWLIESQSHWGLMQEWKPYTYEIATEQDLPGLDQFWAWFESEPWIYEERSLWKHLDARFGKADYLELRRTFQDNYITELDVQRVAELGLNLIRVPIWYEALETDEEGENAFKPDGWERLDRLVGWARKHRVYLMLDMHGTPGGQSTSWHQGLENGGFLWTNQDCIDKTTRLWKAIATYFADEPHIAILNLMNEPMASPNVETYASVHNGIYQAIREVDSNHIIMIEEGYKSLSSLRSPKEMGWQNAMFSLHLYPGGDTAQEYLNNIDRDLMEFGRAFERFECPIYLGEFNAADGNDGHTDVSAEGMDLVLERLNERGIHWGFWTWKYYTDTSTWGLYHPSENPGYRIDVKDAGFDKIKADFQALDSDNFSAHPAFKQAVVDNASAPYTPINWDDLN